MRITVTGGTGFCGKAVIADLINSGISVLSLQRQLTDGTSYKTVKFDLSDADSLPIEALKDVDCLVHMAGIAHQKNASDDDFKRINEAATRILFEKAVTAGVKHFVFFSTVGIYGQNASATKISVDQRESPNNPYALSKYNSEIYMRQRGAETDINVIALRLPMIYGAQAPGSFRTLLRAAQSRLPLPFAGAKNKRSMISVDHVAALVTQIALNPQNFSGTHLVTDGSCFSTREIVSSIRKRQNKNPRLFWFPATLARLIAGRLGKLALYEKLFDDLVFVSSLDLEDLGCIRHELSPAYFIDAAPVDS